MSLHELAGPDPRTLLDSTCTTQLSDRDDRHNTALASHHITEVVVGLRGLKGDTITIPADTISLRTLVA